MPQELVFSSALHHILYTYIGVLNNPFQSTDTLLSNHNPFQSTTHSAVQQIWPPHCSQDVLHQLLQLFSMLIRISRHRDPHTTLQQAKPHTQPPP